MLQSISNGFPTSVLFRFSTLCFSYMYLQKLKIIYITAIEDLNHRDYFLNYK